MTRSKNKYYAKKTELDGIKFDSQKESKRYAELKLLEHSGSIRNLARQVKFTLIPKQQYERECAYYADFAYIDEQGGYIVEDVKSVITRKKPEYIIKRKLMLYEYGIRVTEV